MSHSLTIRRLLIKTKGANRPKELSLSHRPTEQNSSRHLRDVVISTVLNLRSFGGPSLPDVESFRPEGPVRPGGETSHSIERKRIPTSIFLRMYAPALEKQVDRTCKFEIAVLNSVFKCEWLQADLGAEGIRNDSLIRNFSHRSTNAWTRDCVEPDKNVSHASHGLII